MLFRYENCGSCKHKSVCAKFQFSTLFLNAQFDSECGAKWMIYILWMRVYRIAYKVKGNLNHIPDVMTFRGIVVEKSAVLFFMYLFYIQIPYELSKTIMCRHFNH